jgi:hypothetical protein
MARSGEASKVGARIDDLAEPAGIGYSKSEQTENVRRAGQ